jgi:DNA invertase Pin-like site-specific DNA recombinase
MQLEEIRQYCANRGWKVVEEYVDTGISGAKEHRPALDRLLGACHKRHVDAVVVYRYDRFARSLRQLVNALEDFRALGIDFVSLHEGALPQKRREHFNGSSKLLNAQTALRLLVKDAHPE